MRIDVIGRHFEVTDAIREYAESKVAKLTRFFDGVQLMTVIVNGEDHHHSGQYTVELVIDVVKHPDLVSHAKGPDVYVLIDDVAHKGGRQLIDHKEKLRPGH
ncbi:MAG: ribosome-associated translation inhibitor RaiA [Phycisphaeraceae bacterium]|nr:ribosome-associated translation inhibitor RaiA [Phycisphaeraceae bacterium]